MTWANGSLSKPRTATSSGILRPAAFKAAITPNAIVSSPQKMARHGRFSCRILRVA